MYRSTSFLPSTLVGSELSVSRPCRFISGKRAPSSHWIGGWVNPTTKWKFLTLLGYANKTVEFPSALTSYAPFSLLAVYLLCADLLPSLIAHSEGRGSFLRIVEKLLPHYTAQSRL
jgi:hypothetical protein